MKKRWISLLVENEIGVLARISGLFSGKSYNLDSLTVGITEDNTISRMTIGLTSDDKTFEQIKKQLNRSVEVIKVIDLTDKAIHRKELMFLKVHGCSDSDLLRLSCIKDIFPVKMIDCGTSQILMESVQTEEKNSDLITLLRGNFSGRMEVIRGGSVAVEAIKSKET